MLLNIGRIRLQLPSVVRFPVNCHIMITFEYFGPDCKLHNSPSNMTDQNTMEYIEKIKQHLFENLHMVPHASGIQLFQKMLFMKTVAIRMEKIQTREFLFEYQVNR